MTSAEKADFAQRDAQSAEMAAASRKQLEEAKRLTSLEGMESHEMYMPNVSDLSLENAQKSLGIAQVMIRNKEDVGGNVHGRYGDQEISDLNTYVAALKDYISKYDGAIETSNPISQLNANAATTVEQGLRHPSHNVSHAGY